MEHIPKIFISFQNKFFSVLGAWAWVFALLAAVAVILLILNRRVIGEILSFDKPRFNTSNHRELDRAFSENKTVKDMLENGEGSLISCAHCKHLESCKKCSETDYDIAETVCGDFEL